MLTVTKAAEGYLNDVLEKSDSPADAAVRLMVNADGLTAAIDTERPGDAAYTHGARKVLVLDENASRALAERTLDTEQTPTGPRLSVV